MEIETYVDEVPAIRRKRNCLNCEKEFYQQMEGQTICDECLENQARAEESAIENHIEEDQLRRIEEREILEN